MKNKYLLWSLLSMFYLQTTYAQISFTNRNDLLTNSDFNSGGPVGIVDMNNDGKDDIVRMDQGDDLNIEFQNDANTTFTNMYIGQLGWGNWSMCAGDVHNSGYPSVMADANLANANSTGTAYNIFAMPQGGFFVQGSNFVDINNDGWLDAFACNDDGESGIWGNDGTGNLVPQNDWIDMSIDGSSGEPASGNYGSIWTDFDNDGDIDLYIAKCRQGVSNMNDKRRINVLYVNDGDGNFTEMGEEYGVRIAWQSWTADFQDVNNDGWQDLFITNHDHQAQLLINDGTGHYTEATNTGINVQGFPIQGVMRDFDNDGYMDVIVSGSGVDLFRNNGDLTFTQVTGAFDNNSMLSFSWGDLNGDGFIDAYTSYGTGFVSPSNVDDVLWMNDGNDNNWLSFHLEGTISNKDAIGAKIFIYGDWGIQIREVRSGESYGIMNSTNQYFGLGTATEVDSVIIRWPSGIIQKEYDITPNSFVQLIEGGCLAAAPTLDVMGATTFCDGESVTLTAPAGYANYEWSNGATSESIVITEAGNYQLTVTDDDGCFGFSEAVNIIVDPVLSPEISADGDIIICEGESVTLSEIGAPDAMSYTWSNGATGSTVTITESGTYNVVAEGLCQDFTSNSITVDVNDYPDPPSANGETILFGEQANLTSNGNNIAWYDVPTGGTPLYVGDNFTTPNLTVSTTYYVEDRTGLIGLNLNVGQEEHSGSLFAANQNANNSLTFDAYEAFTLDSVTVYTDIEGVRRITLLDQNNNEVTGVEVMIPIGKSTIHLGIEIPVGNNWILGTDGITNFNNIGSFGPRLQRSDNNVAYPYEIQDVVSIKNSDFGTNWYYYFYDWKISTPSHICASDRTPVEVIVDDDVATFDISKTSDLAVFPNPTNGAFTIDLKFEMTDKVILRITDLAGKNVLESRLNQNLSKLNLEELPKGVYSLQIINGNDIYQGKIVFQ